MAIFGSASDVARLDTSTFEAKKLVRNLYSAIPVAELKWADTDLWHLPYIVVMGKNGPALVNSEQERRSITGEGSEISWSVMKNFLTIRHSLAQVGLGFSETSESGDNTPYASGTSVFMGWSLSKEEEDSWAWEDLGYWETLAAAAWTGWCAMKAGDECSNYFIHELGHAQTMQHFDYGTASAWGIDDEYPYDGVHLSSHPWGYDTVSRQFRTWFDPLDGSGKLDPLNGAGESPSSESCFSQYTPYQAMKSQDWALSAPILLSAASSNIPSDGAYKFNTSKRQYMPLEGTSLTNAVGDAAMQPYKVGVPVATFIGTIGALPDVCQTYPPLRSRSGNTFKFPDPFSSNLPSVFNGAAHFVEVRFEDGSSEKGLIAGKDWDADKSLLHFSFNVALERRPVAVDLYRFVNSSYPNLTPQTEKKLLHIRPTDFSPDDPLAGLPPLLRVGRGWLGDSSEIIVDRFCVTDEDCNDDIYNIEWRSDVGSDSLVYKSTLTPDENDAVGATVFMVPAFRQSDSMEYSITILATRFFNDGQGSSPLLATTPLSGDGSSDVDTTHGIRIWAPWEMNKSLPVGVYRSKPGVLKIFAEAVGSTRQHNLLDLNILLNLGTVTARPTPAPTKRPTLGPTPAPAPIRYHIDWKVATCVTDGKESEWAPPYESKMECCRVHMAYEYDLCMNKQP